jgi:hypothetical protein
MKMTMFMKLCIEDYLLYEIEDHLYELNIVIYLYESMIKYHQYENENGRLYETEIELVALTGAASRK